MQIVKDRGIVEKWLYEYETYKAGIENLELIYNGGVTGISYDTVKSGSTNKITSSTEDEALMAIQEKEKTNWLRTRVRMIETAIKGLNETEKEVIKLKYFEGLRWFEIAYKMKYSERWCKQIKIEAIRKLEISILGRAA